MTSMSRRRAPTEAPAAPPARRCGHTPARLKLAVPVLVLALSVSACGGGAQFHHSVVDTGDVRYRMPPPGDAFEQAVVDDYDLAYSHQALGTMGVHATCRDFEDVPLRALLNQLLFGTTDRQRLEQETVTLDGRGALHARYRLALDGVPLYLEAFVLSKNGCLFDFTLVTAVDHASNASGVFRHWVYGFAMLDRVR